MSQVQRKSTTILAVDAAGHSRVVGARAAGFLMCAIVLLTGACSRQASDGAPSAQAGPPSQTYEQSPDLMPVELRSRALAAASPEEIQTAINRWGARAVVASLFGDWNADAGWDRLLERVSAGDEDWLALVPLLRPGTDGATGETLHIAVSHALAHNAPGALRLIASGHERITVCSMIDWQPTEAEIAQFYATTIPAVQAVTEPELRGVRADCLASLGESRPTSAQP